MKEKGGHQKKRSWTSTVLTILILLIMSFFFLSGPRKLLFNKLIERAVEKNAMTLSMDLKEFSLWSGMEARNISLQSDSSFIIHADSMTLQWVNPFRLLRREISSVAVRNGSMNIYPPGASVSVGGERRAGAVPSFKILNFMAEDFNIQLALEDSLVDLQDISVNTDIYSAGDTLGASIRDLHLNLFGLSPGISGEIRKVNDILRLKNIRLSEGSSRLGLNAKLKLQAPWHYELKFDLDPLFPFDYYRAIEAEEDMLSGEINARGRPDEHFVRAEIEYCRDGICYSGDSLDMVFTPEKLLLRSGRVTSEDMKANLKGFIARDSSFDLSAEMSYSRTFLPAPLNDLISSGSVDLSGEWPDSIRILVNGDLNSENFTGETKVAGDLLYYGGKLVLKDTLKAYNPAGKFLLTGWLGTDSIDMDLVASLRHPEDWLAGEMPVGEPKLGALDISSRISGRTTDPDLDGDLTLEDLSYGGDILLSRKLRGFFRIEELMTKRKGDLYLNLSDNSLYHIRNMDGWIMMENNRDTLMLRSIQLSNGDDRIEASARLISDSLLEVSGLAARINDEVLRLDNTFSILLDTTATQDRNIRMSFNDGFINLNMLAGDEGSSRVIVELSDLQIGEMLNFALPETLSYRGLLNARAEYLLSRGEMQGEINILKPLIADRKYDDLKAVFTVDSILNLKSFELRDGSQSLMANARLPLVNREKITELSFDPDAPANVTLVMEEIDLGQYLAATRLKIPISARTGGVISLKNNLAAPEITANLKLEQIRVGKLNYRRGLTKLEYGAGKLDISSATVYSDSGEYKAHGYLPVEISFIEPAFEMHRDSSMYIFLGGHDRHIDYVETYIPIIEELKGDVLSELRISGTPNDPLRDGNLTIKDGTLTIKNMQNTVTQFSGSGRLETNILNLNLSGKMQGNKRGVLNELTANTGSRQNGEGGNIKLTGNIDMRTFFRPVLDLRLQGKQIYYADLFDNFSVVTDADLHLQGRRKIRISGELNLDEGEFNYEFNSRDPALVGKKPSDLAYEIRIPVQQDTYIRNSMLDAELQGEVILTKQPGENGNVGGELQLINGKFYYYSSIFDIDHGRITFDPNRGNHSIDFSASTAIGNGSNRIVANLSGELNKPYIELYDQENRYLSQSEIIRVLTTGIVAEGNNATADVFSGTAQNIVGAVLEKEMERTASDIGGFSRVDFKTNSSGFTATELDSMSILLGRRLGKNLYMTYERNLSTSDPRQELEVEYRINRNMSVIGAADEESVSASFRLRFRY